jgi:aminopeptidase N
MVNFFSRIYPYPFTHYAMTIGYFPGGMEHQTNSLIGEFVIRGNRRYEGLFAHELAHMWFGDLVTLDVWSEIWINEGFAVYGDLLYAEHKYGWDHMRRRLAVTDSVYYVHPELDHPVGAPLANQLFSVAVYNKGGRIVDMLRLLSRMRYMTGPPAPPASRAAEMDAGDERFLGFLSDYLTHHAYGNVTTEDVRAAAEGRMGEDLGWFFDQWLYRTGYPVLQVDSGPGAGGGLTVRVRQTQAEPYRVPIPVRYVSGGVVLDEIRELSGEMTEWTAPLPAGEWSVLLDPEDWVLEKHGAADLFPVLADFGVQPNPSPDRFYFNGEVQGDVGAPARLRVFDIQGRLVTDRDLGVLPPGPLGVYWSARENAPWPAPSGVYVAELRVGEEAFRSRLVLVRQSVSYILH